MAQKQHLKQDKHIHDNQTREHKAYSIALVYLPLTISNPTVPHREISFLALFLILRSFLQVILDKIEFLGIENNIIGDLNCNMSASIADNNTKHLLEQSESYQYTQRPTLGSKIAATNCDIKRY